MVYSSSSVYAYGQYGDSAFFLKRHILHFLIGLVGATFVMSFDYRLFRRYAKVLIISSLILLILVLIPGISREIGGAKRWFRIGIIGFQPSEFASFSLIIYLADFLDRKRQGLKDFMNGFLPAISVIGMVVILVLLQPDLGTAISIFAISLIMLFVCGVNFRYFLPFVLAALPLFYLLILGVPYRRRRIISFLDPWSDPQGAGFQIIQSLLALGSGALFGLGLGQSRQKLFYLPQSHTDFIFSIIGEEMGFVGTLSILLLFALFLYQAMKIILRAKDLFGQMLTLGFSTMIALEVIINIGVSTGALPTKGLPLPFISYGGTALIFNMMSVGLILNVARD